ncbi:MAG TPA: hypothetical protein VII33_03625 [Nakamurella sp.]
MTLLVISPDYASHLLPLAALATAWRDAGDRVVVATGPATTAIVDSFGYRRAWPSGRPTARLSASCRRTGWSGNSCRRWSSCAEPPWR